MSLRIKKGSLDQKGQANLRNSLFLIASSLMIVATIILKNPIFIFSLFLLTALQLMHHSKANGNEASRSFFHVIMRSRKKRRLNEMRNIKKAMISQKFVRPKNFRLFIPLIICLIVLYIFLSHTVFFAVVTSDSMKPSFKTGDILLMQNAEVELQKGDIIMFSLPSVKELVIHRIDSISDDGIKTKGDATNATDKWTVDKDNVEAEVIVIGNKPLVLKSVGWYFIDNAPTDQAPFSGELKMTSLLLIGMKSLGLVIFIVAVVIYLAFTARDIRFNNTQWRRR